MTSLSQRPRWGGTWPRRCRRRKVQGTRREDAASKVMCVCVWGGERTGVCERDRERQTERERVTVEGAIGAVLPCCMHQMVFIDYSLHAMDVTAHGSAPFCSPPRCTWGAERWGRGEGGAESADVAVVLEIASRHLTLRNTRMCLARSRRRAGGPDWGVKAMNADWSAGISIDLHWFTCLISG